MARVIGVDPGDTLVKVVELDGSYRKPRLSSVHTEPVEPGVAKAGVLATAVRAAIDGGMKGEVRLGHPCREAVLRIVDLPFKGKDAIRKVVKAEVEGEIHGYAVDDMVVDFLEIDGAIDGGSRVLVAAVPKDGVRASIEALEAAAIEPESIDLDTLALWRVADHAGAFDAAEENADLLSAVVDVGSRSVKVLLVHGDRLVDMRVLRLGALAVVDDIAVRHGLTHDDAEEVVKTCLTTGEAAEIEATAALPAATEEPFAEGDKAEEVEAQAEETRLVRVEASEVDSAWSAFLQRLRRELVRYLASSGRGDVDVVWLTGGASRASGVAEELTEAFGVEPRELDVLAGIQHDLDEDEVRELGPRLAVAIGLALAPMGGPAGFDLRREDLALARGFERIKFPLTITLMVGLLALFFYGNGLAARLQLLELEVGKSHYDEKGRLDAFFGQVYSVLGGKWWENPRNFSYERRSGSTYRYKDLLADLEAAPVHERVRLLYDKLKLVAAQKQKQSGIYEDVTLESGYAVLVRFAEIMNRLEPRLGRYLLTRLDLDMKGDKRSLDFTVAFRGSDFRQRQTILEQEFEAEYDRPDSPFEKRQRTGQAFASEHPFRDGSKTGVEGAYYRVTVAVKRSFEPFGAGANPGGQ